jgi:hypothetical protein
MPGRFSRRLLGAPPNRTQRPNRTWTALVDQELQRRGQGNPGSRSAQLHASRVQTRTDHANRARRWLRFKPIAQQVLQHSCTGVRQRTLHRARPVPNVANLFWVCARAPLGEPGHECEGKATGRRGGHLAGEVYNRSQATTRSNSAGVSFDDGPCPTDSRPFHGRRLSRQAPLPADQPPF